jgi:multicomponent K+:H+ antiporter subunit A
MGSMLGIVLSENILLLLMFWEMTSLSSFLLISYWQHRSDARNGARMALTITGARRLGAAWAAFCCWGDRPAATSCRTSCLRATIRAHPLYTADAGADPAGGLHQVGAVPVPLLAAAGHGGADAGQAYLHSATW